MEGLSIMLTAEDDQGTTGREKRGIVKYNRQTLQP